MSRISKKITWILNILLIASLFSSIAFAAEPQARVKCQTHVQGIGDNEFKDGIDKDNGDFAGTTKQGKRLEAIKLDLVDAPVDMKIQYKVYVEGKGWDNKWTTNPNMAGTKGLAKNIEAIKIRLVDGNNNPYPGYHVYYQAHMQGTGWQKWVSDDQEAGNAGKGKRLEALRIRITRDDEPKNAIQIKARAHIQSYKDIDFPPGIGLENGRYAGTVGLGKRLEGISLSLVNAPNDMRIQYKGYIEKEGWTDRWTDAPDMTGTKGKAKKLEAIKIRLVDQNGNPYPGYQVKYQVHMQKKGWMDWKSDKDVDSTAGLPDKGLRLEAIRVSIQNYINDYPDTTPVTITKIEGVEDTMEVIKGTSKDSIGLPPKITLALSNGNKIQTDVVWACDDYDGNKAGEYIFKGKYHLPSGISGNAPEIAVKIQVVENIQNQIKDVKINIDKDTGTSKVEGHTDSGNDKYVSIVVLDPNGNIDHINQTTSIQDGKFVFDFKLKTLMNGEYTIKISGTDINTPYKTTIIIPS
ncbi:MAG: hypothetical protein ACFWUE_08375 [Xylanivirga thermophila]|jgi:uncharacterized protein YjdB|uniref:Ig-like domain-containing protein n=1 Tax=Xylanivirga thermophila TaxID=2496273 RepID=UPI0039F577FF